MTCDNGPGDDQKGCPDDGDGPVVVIIIVVVVVVVVCMCIGGASMAYWVHVYQKNEQQQLGLGWAGQAIAAGATPCLLYTSPSPRDMRRSRMPSSA